METAIFIRETSAILFAENFENRYDDVRNTSVLPSKERGEMKGYKVRVVWNDGSVNFVTNDQFEEVNGG